MSTTTVFDRHACNLDDFVAIVEQSSESPPLATRTEQRVPIYESATLHDAMREPSGVRRVRDELADVLGNGAGIFVLAGAVDHDVVDRASDAFRAMIEQQHREGRAIGDHYAKPGANDRVWNAIEKLAVDAPDVFVDYYANDMIALGVARLVRARLPDLVTGQRRQPRRRGPAAPPRLPPRFHDRRRSRGLPRACPPALADAHAAGRGRPLRHAGRDRSDDVPAVLAAVRARVPRLAAPRVRRRTSTEHRTQLPLAQG